MEGDLDVNISVEPFFSSSDISKRLSFDLNEFPTEDSATNCENHTSMENLFEPFVGQCFESEQEAYAFYENYAKRNGFSIRKGRFTKRDGITARRDFFCHREGFPEKKIVNPLKDQRNRESSRCGCKALMRIILKKSFEIFPEQWHVTQFVTQHNHRLLLLLPLEEQVYKVFTNFAFKKFQGEFEMTTQYKEHKVLWDGIVAECSCRNFEFWGIICRHVLSIFLHKDCFQIPLTYLPLRWYRDEYHEIGSFSSLGGTTSEFGILPVSVEDTVRCPPSSIPKGRPKNKRDKSSKELAPKQVKTCRFCKRTGHNITTYRDKESSDANVVSSNIGKKRKTTQENRDLNSVYSLKF